MVWYPQSFSVIPKSNVGLGSRSSFCFSWLGAAVLELWHAWLCSSKLLRMRSQVGRLKGMVKLYALWWGHLDKALCLL